MYTSIYYDILKVIKIIIPYIYFDINYLINQDETLWSIGRETINNYLYEWNTKLDETNPNSYKIKFYFGYSLHSIDKNGNFIFTYTDNNLNNNRVCYSDNFKFDLVIGADGAYSTVTYIYIYYIIYIVIHIHIQMYKLLYHTIYITQFLKV